MPAVEVNVLHSKVSALTLSLYAASPQSNGMNVVLVEGVGLGSVDGAAVAPHPASAEADIKRKDKSTRFFTVRPPLRWLLETNSSRQSPPRIPTNWNPNDTSSYPRQLGPFRVRRFQATSEASDIPPLPKSGDIDAGTYLVTGYTVPFEITVPDGWLSEGGDGLAKDDPDHPDEWAVALIFWPADYVPTDACAWQGALVAPDPSAEAFVDAMTAQTSTASTPPVEVVVGDYSGFEFEHSVEGDVDITACDGGKFCVRSEMSYECTRWYSSAAERETCRVVDLNDERAVIAITQFHESINPELTKEARAIFDSIVFRSDK